MIRHMAPFFLLIHMLLLARCTESLLTKGPRISPRNRLLPLLSQSLTTTVDTSYATVVVKRSRQSMEFRKGSQLIFEGAISYTAGGNEPPQMADLVQVLVEQEKTKSSKKKKSYKHVNSPSTAIPTQLLGWGVYNPKSLYRVRILCHANLQSALSNELITNHDGMRLILDTKILAALATRKALGLPNTETDTYRLINGEGDGLSGLAVDILGGKVAVIMSSATWCQIHRTTIQTALRDILPSNFDIVWKTTPSRLSQDGWEESEDQKTEEEPISEKADEASIVRESGISYVTFPFVGAKSQKTGFYCDQRDNRKQLSALCHGKRVLDLCCYHGGFSLTAKLLGGASHCTGVDTSQNAIDACYENAKLNGLKDDISFERADIDKFMKEKADQKQYWDVIVLDPPKLAPSISGLDRASRKYHSFNRDAIRLINPDDGGLFLTCTCSAAMTQKSGGQYFLEVVQRAAAAAGRSVTLLQKSGAAPCHVQSPASYPAGAYLTAALFYVAPTTMMLNRDDDEMKL